MTQLLTLPIARASDSNNDILSGAKLYCYLTNSTTLADVYTTSALNVAHANPVVASSAGLFPAIFLDPDVTYRFVVKTSAGVAVSGMDFDPVSGLQTDSISTVQSFSGASARSLTAVLRDAPPKLEDFGGGPSASGAVNSAAMAAHLLRFDNSGEDGFIQLLAGTYELDDAITAPTFARNITIEGLGPGRSTLKMTGTSDNGFVFPTGLNINVRLAHFTLRGPGGDTSYSGTGMGIYQPLGAGANDSYNIELEDIWVSNFGSHAIALCDVFNSVARNVHINYCGGNGFVAGGNTLMFDSCYVHNLPENNAIGYRLFSGQAVLINCNGVDDCDIWGRFGRSTSDSNDLSALLGAAADEYCSATLIGSNIEAFNTIGLWLSNGYLWIDPSCRITSKPSATGVKAILARSHAGGFLGSIPQLGSGGSWANSRSVHALGTDLVPFTKIDGDNTQTQFTYYDDVAGADRVASVNGNVKVLTSRYAQVTADHRVTNTMGYMAGAGGTATQGTDKSTAVQVDKATGNITMNNATLNAGTAVSFTLTNSQVESTDLVLVQHISGGTVGAYTVTAVGGSGSATITVRNNTAGNLSEAIVLKFMVLKAATT